MRIERSAVRVFFTQYSPSLFLLFLCMVVPTSSLPSSVPMSDVSWRVYIPAAFTFHFTHANIFHLLANFYVIACFCPRWANLPVAYLSATAAALAPLTGMSTPTVGISAIVFAMLARRDALLHIWNWRLLGFNLLTAFVPCCNWKIHLLAYLIAFIIWKIYMLLNDRLHSKSGRKH